MPENAQTVADVRHTPGPLPAGDWIERAALPEDALARPAGEALLLEVEVREGALRRVESAPLDLANLIVRIEQAGADASVIAIENRSGAVLGLELFASREGSFEEER